MLLSDATTSTEEKKKKRVKRKKKSVENTNKPAGALVKSIGTSKNKSKQQSKKLIEKISVDIQCSLYKDDDIDSKQTL